MSTQIPTDDEFEQAAEWIEDAADWTPERRSGFLSWVAQSPRHLDAARRVWALDRDSTLDRALEDWRAVSVASADVEHVAPPPSRPRAGWARPRGLAAAACLVAAVTGVLVLKRPVPDTVLVSGDADPGISRLADGSRVHLDPATRLVVSIGRHDRSLSLDRGRALFEVAHDAKRPFTVHAGEIAATAVGTVYSVDRAAGSVIVKVEKGRVRASDGAHVILLDPGEGARFAGGTAPARLHFTPDPAAADDGIWLHADADRLDTIASRLQRRTRTLIAIAPDIAALPVTGRFRLADPEGSLQLIAETNGLVIGKAPGRIRLAH